MILDEKNILKNITEFKNELLKKVNSLESKLTHKMTLHDKDFSMKLDILSEKIIPIETDVSTLVQISSEKEEKLEKIESLQKFKNKAESALLSQNIRLNKLTESIGEIRSKYDKIFVENLTIPGFVGHSCKYKNISEFIVHNIKENNKNENQYDEVKNEVISLKQKTDYLQKIYFGIFDNVYERTNQLVENKIENLKVIYEKKFEEILNKVNDVKLKDIENRMNLEKHFKEFKLFTEDVYSFKEHLDKIEIKINQDLNNNKKEIIEDCDKKKNDNNENNSNNSNNNNNKQIKKSVNEFKKENDEIKKISKSIEEKEIKTEKIISNNINNIKSLKEEINAIKGIIKLGRNEVKMNINNLLNKFNNELNQLKQNLNEINSKSKNTNHPIKYHILDNFPTRINNEKISNNGTKKIITIRKEKEEGKNNISKDLINNDGLNTLNNNTYKGNIKINKEIKFEQETINISEYRNIKSNEYFKKNRNYGIINSARKKLGDKKNLFLNKFKHKKNLFSKEYKKIESMSMNVEGKINEDELLKEEEKIIPNKEVTIINNKNDHNYIPNIYEEKSTQYKLDSSRNKSPNEYSNIFNLSFNNINGDKAKRKRKFLSPIVDKMYKEYYIKNNMKEKNKGNNEENKKYTIKKLVPAFGRTNYKSYE